MRKLLMIAAFAAFAACAKQSDTDVGETTPQTDETTTSTPPADQNTAKPSGETTTPPSTGYEPQPSTADTMQTPPGDSAATERSIPDASAGSTGTWGDTSSTTVPDSL